MINKDTLPLVTVIAACYNQEKFVVESLESIKAQTYPNIEIIIWDDCSKDNSVKVIEDWIEKNNIDCRFIKHTQNKGICKSLNEAISYANGKYFQMIALDDILLFDKILKQVEIIEDLGDDYGLVFTDTYLIDENGGLLDDTFHSRYTPYFNSTNNYNFFEDLLQGNIIHGLSAIFKLDVFKQIGGYDENLFVEDWDMHIRLSLKTKIFFDSSYISAKYRITSFSTNNNPELRLKCVESSFDSFKKFYGVSKRGNELILIKLHEFAWIIYKANYLNWQDKFITIYQLTKSLSDYKYYLLAKNNIGFSNLKFLKRKMNATLNIFGLKW